MKYDTTFKDLFPDVHVLFTLLTHSYPVKIENVEFASVRQRRADLVAWLAKLESESLSDNLLALLGKFKDKQSVMQRVLHRIAHLDKNRRADMLEKLAILAGLRPAELPKLIKQELEKMPISIDLEENPFLLGLIQRGEERGEKRGKRLAEIVMLQRLLANRFGTLPEWVDHLGNRKSIAD